VQVDAVSPAFTAVLVDVALRTAHPTARLVASTDEGRTFRSIGPRVPDGTHGDSVFFLDRTHGWFTVALDGDATDLLYRTTDGGRTWKHWRVAGHSAGAPAVDQVLFTDAQHGWLNAVSGTGPQQSLFRSTDGGRTWRSVRTGRTRADSSLGYLDVGSFRLWRSGWYGGQTTVGADGGRNWRRSGPSVHGTPGEVAVFGRTVIAPMVVRSCRACEAGRLRIFRATGNGGWKPVASSPRVFSWQGGRSISSSFVTPGSGWIAGVGAHGRIVVFRYRDGILRRIRAPELTGSQVTIRAPGARQAWLSVVPPRGAGGPQIFVTRDAGREWHRVRP